MTKKHAHNHDFHQVKTTNFHKVLTVVTITLVTMLAEIILGWLFGSMALLSDGWHMATHASALAITLSTYYFAKKHARNTRYTFGTWKMEILGAFTSALFLLFVGAMIIYTSIERILNPVTIFYDQAIIVTIIGLIVNIICAFVIGHHDHAEHDHHHEHDLNMKSAYIHVLADALTSIFALIALFSAKMLQLSILDPLMGIISAALIFRWSFGLLRDASNILLDKNDNLELIKEITDIIKKEPATTIADLHLWQIGQDKYSCIMTLVAKNPKTAAAYKKALQPVHELAHITIELIKK